ncbi:potassium transporter 1 [Phalaenopsis equestris]|uniref:potassium transporter 1 n=1 Tax=Phalaenopsis equestris TaxID=78828 RepID=UPI0009E64427|nr:potassium transporter 1 [Phalaenopsis equestris]
MSSSKPPPFAPEEGSEPFNRKKSSYKDVLILAYQSLGVVYGDLSTSPLYVYKTTFSGKLSLHESDEEVFGVFSFIFWTLTLIPLLKYIYFVLSADDNGEGGTFALYSLLCRHARLSILPNQQADDENLSTYDVEGSTNTWQSAMLNDFFNRHPRFKNGLLIVVLLGTCMAIGDGVLTPTISVLSAVSGVRVKITNLHENYVVALSCLILVVLFSLQRYGTHRVGFMFAPIVIAWLFCISGIGIYNIFKWNPSIFRAISPGYMCKFLRSTGVEGWVSLSGVVLCITGAETMFANLGHFSPISIKIAFTFLVYPCLILAYMGEAAFLSKHHDDIQRSFYKAIPESVFWPVFIVATCAAVVGSQAVISATFSIVSQCCALNCFPLVKIIHTSNHIYGQIYIPEVNWILMCLCLAVTIGLKNTNMIGHAYGLAVTVVIFVTTWLMSLVIIIVWKKKIISAIIFLIFFGSIELIYLSSSFVKIPEGGWIPLTLSIIFMSVMYIWNYGTLLKHEFDLQNKVSVQRILALAPKLGIVRVPGIGLVYSDVLAGIPAVFGQFAMSLPAFHQVLIFVCIKSVQVPFIPESERFLVGRVGTKEHRMFRCVLRYGYKDLRLESYEFESQLVSKVVSFVELEESLRSEENAELPLSPPPPPVSIRSEESVEILKEKECGVVYISGHSYAKAKSSSSLMKKFTIDVVYAFLSKNCRAPDVQLSVPHSLLLKVGMVYYV